MSKFSSTVHHLCANAEGSDAYKSLGVGQELVALVPHGPRKIEFQHVAVGGCTLLTKSSVHWPWKTDEITSLDQILRPSGIRSSEAHCHRRRCRVSPGAHRRS
jgi:hypothetical protein